MFFNRSKNIDQLSDEELIRLYQDREDEEYVGELYNRHSDKIYVVARNMVNDRDAAQDIVMSVFEKVLKNLLTTDVQSFSNWVFIIAKNECNQYLRSSSNNAKRMTEWGENQRNTFENVENDGLERLLNEEQDYQTRNRVQSAIEQLKEEQKICVVLFYYEGKSYRDIAYDTGYSENEVKSYLQNGKKNLEKLLNPNW